MSLLKGHGGFMALLQASGVTVIKIHNVFVQDVSLAKAEFISSLGMLLFIIRNNKLFQVTKVNNK